jgi:hypothetical protein
MKSLAERLTFAFGRVRHTRRWPMVVAVLMVAGFVSACAPSSDDPVPGAEVQSAQVGYLQAPRLTATTLSDRSFTVKGIAAKGARIRLSSPEGQAFGTTADDQGVWQIDVPRHSARPQQTMLFGLSEDQEGRIIQAEFYVALLPDPQVPVVLLRAGTGAQTLANGPVFAITTADFDNAGGLTVSGFAPAGKPIKASLEGSGAIETFAGQDGRFSLGLTPSAPATARQIEIQSGIDQRTLTLDVSAHRLPAGTLADTTRLVGGWRIDWTTPSGGVQTTYIQSPKAGVKP